MIHAKPPVRFSPSPAQPRPPHSSTHHFKQPRRMKKYLFFIVVVLLLGGSLFAAVYFYRQYKKAVENPQIATQNEVKKITGEIGKFMDLPQDEEPTLATITNREKLEKQQFFANAQNGDKVLVYAKSGKAILYRPSTKRVVEVTSLYSGAAGSEVPAKEIPVGPEETLPGP